MIQAVSFNQGLSKLNIEQRDIYSQGWKVEKLDI